MSSSSSSSSVLSLRNHPLTWIIASLLPIFTFSYGYFTIFIITALILISSSVMFLTLSKHKQVLEQEQPQLKDEHILPSSDQIVPNQAEDEVHRGCLDMGLPDSYSESEVIDQFSSTSGEDSDFDCWQFSGGACRSPDCSDGSISDEESLIEIALPSGHYVGSKGGEVTKEEPKLCFQQKLTDFSPEYIYRWPEMNEEENLIEIDISVGSIKCSRFEIKA